MPVCSPTCIGQLRTSWASYLRLWVYPSCGGVSAAGWDPVIGQVIAAITGPGGSGFQWGMYDDRPSLSRWSSGRLTLHGDAAHAAAPGPGR